ncbi:MAG TPA: hypothetical protein VM935_04060, partial [Chitinophagaceae bacterium]|nr:hypothetical protein [Chitinophagaceae bacterium]
MPQKKVLTLFAMLFSALFFIAASNQKNADTPRRLEILFLGHKNNRNHNSERLADILSKEYFKDGINISFTSDPNDLNETNLNLYDGLIVYANHDSITK